MTITLFQLGRLQMIPSVVLLSCLTVLDTVPTCSNYVSYPDPNGRIHSTFGSGYEKTSTKPKMNLEPSCAFQKISTLNSSFCILKFTGKKYYPKLQIVHNASAL